MIAVLIELGLKFWPYIAGALGVVAVIFQQRRAGAKAERAKREAAEDRAKAIADQVQNDVGALPPGAAKEELRKW